MATPDIWAHLPTWEAMQQRPGYLALKTDQERAAYRAQFDQELFDERVRLAKEANPNLARLAPLVSAVSNFGDQAGLGAPRTIASAATAPVTAYREDTGLKEAYRRNLAETGRALEASPTASAVGRLGAFFAPTPARFLAGKAGGAASAPLTKAAAAEQSLLRAGVKQIGAAYAGGASAIGAVNTGEAVLGGDDDVADLVSRTWGDITSPSNLLVTGSVGAVPSAFRAIPDREKMKLIEAGRRLIPGFKASPTDLREEGFIQGLLDTLARKPAGRGIVNRILTDTYYKPLRKTLDDIQSTVSGGRARDVSVSQAAAGVRRMTGTPGKAGTFAKERKSAMGRAMRRAGSDPVSDDELSSLLRTMDGLESRAASRRFSEGESGAKIRSVLFDPKKPGSLRNVIAEASAKGGTVTVQQLDDIKSRLGEIAEFDKAGNLGKVLAGQAGIGARDVREAKLLYRAIREVERRQSPVLDQALRDATQLRQLEKTLAPLARAVEETDDKLLTAVINQPGFPARWQTLVDRMPAEQVQAFRGQYLARFLERVELDRGKGKGHLGLSAMRRLFRGGGEFRESAFDTIMGDKRLRQEMLQRAEVSSMVSRNLGRAEGAQTYGRQESDQVLDQAGGLAASAMGLTADPVTGPLLMRMVLGLPGTWMFTRSILEGRIGSTLNRLATGQAVSVPAPTLAALAHEGGVLGRDEKRRGLLNVGTGAYSGALQPTGELLRFLSQQGRPDR